MIFILNIDVITQKGINYQMRIIKLPLYLKLLDFFDRHYNYKYLVKLITRGAETDRERAMKIFVWTYENLRKTPGDMPVIDDHGWYIIVRGYGNNDQFQDVFTTLCNYAHIDAFFTFVSAKDLNARLPLSFVKLNKKWCIFDPYNGAYFKNSSGGIASIEEIMEGDWAVFNFAGINKQDYDYVRYFENLKPIKNVALNRANTQTPLRRLIFEFKKYIKQD